MNKQEEKRWIEINGLDTHKKEEKGSRARWKIKS